MRNLTQLSLLALSAIFFLWLAYLCHFGIDLSDEGYHLISIANPLSYPDTTSQFGLFYYPIYVLLQGDIPLLRITNLFSLLFLSILFFIYFFKINDVLDNTLERIYLAIPLSFSSFVFLSTWQPTPSYNTLNLIALLGVFLSVQIINNKHENARLDQFAWVLLGIFLGIVFLNKATSAVVAGIGTALYLISNRCLDFKKIPLAIFSGIITLLLTAFILDGSLIGFISRIALGLEGGKLLVGDNWTSIQSMLWRGNIRFTTDTWIFSSVFIVISTALFLLSSSANKILNHVATVIIIGAITYCAMLFFSLIENPLSKISDPKRLSVAIALPISVFLSAIVLAIKNQQLQFKLSHVGTLLALLLFSYAFVAGTVGNYFYTMLKAVIFLVMASLLFFIKQTPRSSTLPLEMIAYASLTITFLLIHAGIHTPHRQPTKQLANKAVQTKLHFLGNQLKLPQETEKYLSTISSLTENNDYVKGSPIIDMTGVSPGALYAINAKAIGAAWLIGGYKGSDKRAITALKREPEKLVRSSWVLTEPSGKRALSTAVLQALNIQLDKDYILVGKVAAPKGLSGRKTAREQFLYKPKAL